MKTDSKIHFKHAWGMVRKANNQNKRRLKMNHSPEHYYNKAHHCWDLRCEAAENIRCWEETSLELAKARRENKTERRKFYYEDIIYCQTRYF